MYRYVKHTAISYSIASEYKSSALRPLNIAVQQLGSIHSHFVRSISNSTVDHFEIDSINVLIFCTGCLMTKMQCIRHHMIFDVE